MSEVDCFFEMIELNLDKYWAVCVVREAFPASIPFKSILDCCRSNRNPGEATLSNMISLPSGKGSTQKRKEFTPNGSNFFPFRVDPFMDGAVVQEAYRKFTKVISLVGYDGKSTICIQSL